MRRVLPADKPSPRGHQFSPGLHQGRTRHHQADIDTRDLITSITGGDLLHPQPGQRGRRRSQYHRLDTKGMGAVRDLDVSPDGTNIVFSLRLPLNPKKPNTDVTQPNWHI